MPAARLRRSVLAVPGSNPRMMEKAAASAADEVFLDLEDACAPLEKPEARGKIVEALRSHDWHGKTRVVRINQVTSEFAFDDLREGDHRSRRRPRLHHGPQGSQQHRRYRLRRPRAAAARAGARDFPAGRIGIEAQIEDVEGLMRADEIACSSARAWRR